MSSKTDFEMYAGDTRMIVVSVTDQDGTAVDLTGGSVLWQLATKKWENELDAAVVVSKSSTEGQITLAVGSFTVRLLSDDTVGLDGSYYHEAQVTLIDGTIGTPLVGTIKIKPNLIEPR